MLPFQSRNLLPSKYNGELEAALTLARMAIEVGKNPRQPGDGSEKGGSSLEYRLHKVRGEKWAQVN